MIQAHALVLLLSTILTATAASDVLLLADDNFQDTVKEKDLILVQFHAPWCGHCKKLAPEYEKVAAQIKDDELSDLLSITLIDGTVNDSPVESMDWTTFPTFCFVK